MRIVAVMPIKTDNERLPGKNTRDLGGRPLLQHALGTLLGTRIFDRVYVYCSDASITQYLPGGAVFLERPAALDAPSSNFTQIFGRFMEEVSADVYAYAHATAPFISAHTVRQCVDAVVHGGYDSAFSAARVQDYLWAGGQPLNFDAADIPRSQDLEPVFRETSGIYVIPRGTFLRYRRRVGAKPFIREVGYKEAVDINCLEDFRLAEALLGACLD